MVGVRQGIGGADQDWPRECALLYRQLFGCEAPAALCAAYARAHGQIPGLADLSADEVRTLSLVVASGLNAAGVEFWLRRPGRRHALSRKLLLIAYLEETGHAGGAFARDRADGRWALPMLALAGIGGLAAALLGALQKVRYGLR